MASEWSSKPTTLGGEGMEEQAPVGCRLKVLTSAQARSAPPRESPGPPAAPAVLAAQPDHAIGRGAGTDAVRHHHVCGLLRKEAKLAEAHEGWRGHGWGRSGAATGEAGRTVLATLSRLRPPVMHLKQ